MPNFVEQLAKKWCPNCGHHLPRAECVCQVIAAAISETLDEAERIAHQFATHPDPTPMTEWVQGAIQTARDIAAAITALRGEA